MQEQSQKMYEVNPKEMYDSLLEMCNQDTEKKFFYQDYPADDKHVYRIFGYQIPRYKDYSQPYAKECRGSMFLVEKESDQMIKILALPMPKFFAFEESLETQDIKFEDIKRGFLKPDGSLITSYHNINNELAFKTKRAPEQAMFNEILEEVLYPEFKAEIDALTQTHTIDFELTSPKNRVILPYNEAKIHVLKARSRDNGYFLDLYTPEFEAQYPEIYKHLVEPMDIEVMRDLHSRNRNLDIKGIEGLVLEMNDGQMVKVKTVFYLSQNKFANIQDFKKYDQLLTRACIEETFDDLRTLFHYRNRSENYAIDEILDRMAIIENKVAETYNPFLDNTQGFYERNKHLSMPDYQSAIKEQGLQKYMGALMPLYKGDKVNLKNMYMKMIGDKLKSR